MPHVLIVDDEQSICWGLRKLVETLGHSAAVASSAEQALGAAKDRLPDVIILDVRLPGLDGLSAMAQFRAICGDVPFIIITAYGDLGTAVEAVRNGAFEYLVKPFDLGVAQRAIERAIKSPEPSGSAGTEKNGRRHRLEQGNAAAVRAGLPRLVGSSPAMQEVFKRIAVVAPADACVHVRGESGTGKELVARAIHQYSRRSDGPFVPVNVASLSPSLAESELFGHVRGAFTGAEQARKGLLEQAHGGTIFFDEVADIPLGLQVKLLRVLEYGEVLPVGASRPLRSDFRVISATHRNLHERVVRGEFREDLYFRLITFEIELPPLRERTSDIADLGQYFLETLSAASGSPCPRLGPELLKALEARPWYGNVRELRNALEHALILARGGPILTEHLPLPTPPGSDSGQTREAMLAAMIRDWAHHQVQDSAAFGDLYDRLLRIVEPPLLETVLQRHRGQFLAAAKELGLHRVTLKRKASQYGDLGAS
ncbi:MAG: sigma-54 dependent transcriptional regulator [Planctomycetaceae bacterium]|nr:sigma-54 dependent transcriptional regulator [Planctomycetaceae bacterium]